MSVQNLNDAVSHPKTAWLAMIIVQVSEWYVDWASPIILALTSIFSLFIVIALYRVHRLKARLLELEIDNQIRINKQANHDDTE